MSDTGCVIGGRCGTCQHWDREAVTNRWRVDLYLERLPGESDDHHRDRVRDAEGKYGQCRMITLLTNYDLVAEDALPVAFCKDGSDYKAELYTLSDFGCALWAASESATEVPLCGALGFLDGFSGGEHAEITCDLPTGHNGWHREHEYRWIVV